MCQNLDFHFGIVYAKYNIIIIIMRTYNIFFFLFRWAKGDNSECVSDVYQDRLLFIGSILLKIIKTHHFSVTYILGQVFFTSVDIY